MNELFKCTECGHEGELCEFRKSWDDESLDFCPMCRSVETITEVEEADDGTEHRGGSVDKD